MSERDTNVQSSLITSKRQNKWIRYLHFVDIFSFLPVPKDDNVSTKQSIIGTIIFLFLLLTYILYDFITFVVSNTPIQQTYRSPIDESIYILPDFAIAFMTNQKQSTHIFNITQSYENLFTYQWTNLTKQIGNQYNKTIQITQVTYNKITNISTNFQKLSWMNSKNKQFYYYLRTPTLKNLTAQGLLYSSQITQYNRIKISYCKNSSNPSITCLTSDEMNQLSNYGRFFLFIQNKPDQSPGSKQNGFDPSNTYILYNFFAVPGYYKRVNINFQVIKTQILPDYFNRFQTEYNTRLQVESINTQLSVVNFNNTDNTDAIAFNMQLSPIVINTRIVYSNLIDHVSKWGALSGVLISIFSIFFLSYNKRKFYNRNPQWQHFKQTLNKGL